MSRSIGRALRRFALPFALVAALSGGSVATAANKGDKIALEPTISFCAALSGCEESRTWMM
ncbi:MAG TPA: hypothetical protein PLV68_17085, partial [Ilumatobacteraceae bacterium]|nr:hypothetical protein [Ilumatobacteraceae bacterium]